MISPEITLTVEKDFTSSMVMLDGKKTKESESELYAPDLTTPCS